MERHTVRILTKEGIYLSDFMEELLSDVTQQWQHPWGYGVFVGDSICISLGK